VKVRAKFAIQGPWTVAATAPDRNGSAAESIERSNESPNERLASRPWRCASSETQR
jgi:hypothetical protein